MVYRIISRCTLVGNHFLLHLQVNPHLLHSMMVQRQRNCYTYNLVPESFFFHFCDSINNYDTHSSLYFYKRGKVLLFREVWSFFWILRLFKIKKKTTILLGKETWPPDRSLNLVSFICPNNDFFQHEYWSTGKSFIFGTWWFYIWVTAFISCSSGFALALPDSFHLW